jgi:hypothetical protein
MVGGIAVAGTGNGRCYRFGATFADGSTKRLPTR